MRGLHERVQAILADASKSETAQLREVMLEISRGLDPDHKYATVQDVINDSTLSMRERIQKATSIVQARQAAEK